MSIADKINLVLNEEKRAYKANGRRGGGLGSFNTGLETEWTTVGEIPKLITDVPSLDILHSENAKILLKIYSSLSGQDRNEFQNILISYLSKESPYYEVSYLTFFILHRAGKTEEAITQAKNNLKEAPENSFSNLLGILKNIIKYEHAYLSEEELEKIKNALGDENEFQLHDRINSAQLKNLSTQLENTNQEINEDKEVLKSQFKKYNFPDDLTETLDKIDQKFNTASDNFDYKGCMDLLRSFTERFYQIIAKSINPESGSKMDEKDSEKIAKFFKETNIISDDQGKILISLRHFLSNQGSHKLKSLPEDARLSKNMTIEFCLYILRKYQDIKGN